MMQRILLMLGGALLVCAIAGITLLLARKPQANADWQEVYSKAVTTTSHADGTLTLHDARDWTYGSGTVLTKDWHDITVDPDDIQQVWFLLEPFHNGAIAHTFLSFEFKDGSALSFSIEARLKNGQEYSGLAGVFRSYELSYTWGTERDFVSRRVSYLKHDLHRYPLTMPDAMKSALFRRLAQETDRLAAHPRFYNTLIENCTNVLAYNVNTISPHALPWDISWYLTGLSDAYLMRQGYIDTKGKTSAEVRSLYDLQSATAQIQAAATSTPVSFTALLDSVAAGTMH
jgi:hypothetical protein